MAKKQKNKYSHRIEQLQKGAMRRLAPFKPENIDPDEHFSVSAWQEEHSDDGMMSQDFRESIPSISGPAKKRMFNKLLGSTKTKKNKDGSTSFLLHRGVSGEEYDVATINPNIVSHDKRTSWTTSWDKANRFANSYSDGGKPKVLTAWVHENNIVHMPKIYGKLQRVSNDNYWDEGYKPKGHNRYADEHEIIVDPHQSEHAPELSTWKDPEVTNPQNIDQKIKSNSTNYYGDNHERRKQKAREYLQRRASSKISKNMKGLRAGILSTMLAASPNVTEAAHTNPEPKIEHVQRADKGFDPVKRKKNILRAIAQVESSGGKNTQHAKLPENSIHRGERAFGSYGLTPLLIRETARKHQDLMEQHPDLHRLQGKDMLEYMSQNPHLEHDIASRHYDRLSKKFGHDPSKIGYAWLNGVNGTIKAVRRGADLNNHWHVQKINRALENIRNKQKTPKMHMP